MSIENRKVSGSNKINENNDMKVAGKEETVAIWKGSICGRTYRLSECHESEYRETNQKASHTYNRYLTMPKNLNTGRN